MATPFDLLVTEAQWQQKVTNYALLTKWYWFHHRQSKQTRAGWPDLTLVRPPHTIFVELKREKGVLRPAQRQTIIDLTSCGLWVYVWRPSDWPQVEHVLRLGPG
jgi:hypothetical protein